MSESKPPGKVLVHVRLTAGGVGWLDRLAQEAGLTRTDALRAALRVAVGHERAVKEQMRLQAEASR